MTYKLLIAKGDYEDLGKNWIAGFLKRYNQLQSR